MGVPAIMRDAVLQDLFLQMQKDDKIFFLSADLGGPKLDQIREKFPDRFINVGIAEQNLINVAAGLALEGYKVFAYAIATFLTMRCYEQIRVHLSILAQLRSLNVTMIGLGIGMSYDVAGPSHHCFEDLSIMRTLPGIKICSPADSLCAQSFVTWALNYPGVKYLRLDGKPHSLVYSVDENIPAGFDFEKGFCELKRGHKSVIVSTGVLTHRALNSATAVATARDDIGVIDIYSFDPDFDALFETIDTYAHVITLEEGFIGVGGVDSMIANLLCDHQSMKKFTRLGIKKEFLFDCGGREYLHKKSGINEDEIRYHFD
ncbi:MAG: transketolase [Oligoflexia bacterium]|nr:transketolase [Oligoflexia bacterium]